MDFRKKAFISRLQKNMFTYLFDYNLMKISFFFILMQTIFATPTYRRQTDPELIVDSNVGLENLNFDTRRNLQTNSDRLDSNSDDVRVHKRHHHHHDIRHLDDTDDETLITIPSNAEYTEMCLEGQISDDSDITWENTDCEICHCEGGGVSCHHDPCPDLPCHNPVRVENECCPVCPEKICEARDGRKFNDGSRWHLDDCTFCECAKGRDLCSVEDCEFKSCSNPTKVPGQCCPICPDSSCHGNNGRNHTAGAVWKEGECTHCYCRQGEKVCAEEKCPYINCSHPYRQPGECCYKCPGAVECVVSDWGTWGDCPIQECGGGMRRRYRSIVIPPRNGGSFCPHMSEAHMCPRLPCDDIPVCPVTPWSSWSHCTATCGVGRRLRMRKKSKVTKATMTSLIDCSTTHMQETMRCETGTCNLVINEPEPDIDHCYAVTWSDWSSCSVACGVGFQTREQRLENASHPLGHLCHLLQESKQCHSRNCTGTPDNPIHCKVTHWSPWTPCSATCGPTAAKSKHRTILRHPSVGGRACPNLHTTRPCILGPCDGLNLPDLHLDDRCVSDNGLHHYAENEHWNPLECIACSCINSKKVCQPIVCLQSECTNPVKIAGYCCPFCFSE